VKNRLITMAGALALLVVVGKFYATPALAQVVRAALVKNVDEKGRSPYMQFQPRVCSRNSTKSCDVVFPPVPAGKRLVLEHLNAGINFATSGVRFAGVLIAQDSGLSVFPTRPSGDPNLTIVNEPTLLYFEAGQTPTFRIGVNNDADVPVVTATLSGYLVDLEQ